MKWEKIGFGALVFATVWFVALLLVAFSVALFGAVFEVGPMTDDFKNEGTTVTVTP